MIADLPRRVYRRSLGLPANMALKALNIPAIEARLLASHQRALEKHKPDLPKLTATQADIVAGLERNGVHVTTLAALAMRGTDEMFEAACGLADSYAERLGAGSLNGKTTIQADAAELLRNPSIFRWGVNDGMLQIAEAYLGLPVGYDGLNLFYTVADGREVAARKWHRDCEDRRMLKVAVYLNDVDEAGGPFQVLHRDVAGSRSTRPFDYRVLTQKKLEQSLADPLREGDVTTCVGPAGTVVFADTARFYHRGKPAVSRDRRAIFYNYMTRVPRHPFFCERSVLSRAQIAELAAEMTPSQRACVLWRDALPLIARIIPPHPL